jgi:hypothetical protein
MHLLKGMSKKRHTRAPYEIHTFEGMVKKRHPYAHSPGNFNKLNCYDMFFFGEGVPLEGLGSFTIRHRQTASGSPLDSSWKALGRIQEPQVHAV